MKKHSKKKYPRNKIFLYSIFTLIILFAWMGAQFMIIKLAVLGYFLYRLAEGISKKFRCSHCVKNVTVAGALALLLTGILPGWMYVGAIVAMWAEPYLF